MTCLGLIPGTVRRLPGGQKVPHIGWNSVRIRAGTHPLLEGVPDDEYFYFVHSYYVDPTDPAMIVGETELRRDVRLDRAPRQRLRDAVPPREELGDRARIYEQLRPPRAQQRPTGRARWRPSRVFEVIPAIDLQGGRCVRLVQGDFDRVDRVRRRPAGMARRWEAAGAAPHPRRRSGRRQGGRPASAGDRRRDRQGGAGAGPAWRRHADRRGHRGGAGGRASSA